MSIFAVIVAAAVIFDPIILGVLLALVGAVGVYEALVPTGYIKSRFMTAICLVYAFVTPFVYTSGFIKHEAMLVILAVVLFSIGLFNHQTVTPAEVGYAFCTTVAITFSFWAMYAIFISADGHGLFYLIMVFVIAWGCDTGAYFVGYFFGKHKMAPEISPKKTVEGAVGGLVSAMVFVYISCLVFSAITDCKANILLFVGVSPVLAFVGMLGDLIASYVKRAAGIKDYGRLFPGHGGVLDRFDSVLTVIPLLYIIVTHLPVIV